MRPGREDGFTGDSSWGSVLSGLCLKVVAHGIAGFTLVLTLPRPMQASRVLVADTTVDVFPELITQRNDRSSRDVHRDRLVSHRETIRQRLALGESQWRQGNWPKALDSLVQIRTQFAEGLAKEPALAAEVEHWIGRVGLDLGRDEMAAQALKRSLTLNPLPTTRVDLAAAYASLERDDLALPLLHSALVPLELQAIPNPEEQRTLARGKFILGKLLLFAEEKGDSDQPSPAALLAESAERYLAMGKLSNAAAALNLLNFQSLLERRLPAMERLVQTQQLLQDAIAQAQGSGNGAAEARARFLLGSHYFFSGQYDAAVDAYAEASELNLRLGHGRLAGDQRSLIGSVYNVIPQYAEAAEAYGNAIAIFEQLDDGAGSGFAGGWGDRRRLSNTLYSLAGTEMLRGNNADALKHRQRALMLLQALHRKMPADLQPPPQHLARIYLGLGESHLSLGQYDQALMQLEQARDRYQAIASTDEAAMTSMSALIETWRRLGEVYTRLTRYPEALAALEKALPLAQAASNKLETKQILVSLADVHGRLGQMDQAREHMQQVRRLGDLTADDLPFLPTPADETDASAIATASTDSLETLAQQSGSGALEVIALSEQAREAEKAGEFDRALDLSKQVLARYRSQGNRTQAMWQLAGIGLLQQKRDRPAEALAAWEQVGRLASEAGDRDLERTSFHFIGQNLESQNQTELAIVFYKRFVERTEILRGELRRLPRAQQRSFQNTFSATYRHLAALLLERDRVLEAQQVLDALKVQELEEYLQDVRGGGAPISFSKPEEEILTRYDGLRQGALQLGQELSQLRQVPEARRSVQQRDRLAQLTALENDLKRQFNAFVESDRVQALLAQLSRRTRRQNVDPSVLNSLRQDLRAANSVLLYPLILEDRLELVLTTPDAAPIRRTVDVDQQTLNRTIVELRRALQDPTKDAQAPAQQLYQWLIAPLEPELQQLRGEMNADESPALIYAPDGPLRYVPLAALHDGDRWLIERFRVNNITAQSLTDLSRQPQPNVRLLAGAFDDATVNYPIQVGPRKIKFQGLPFAGQEARTITTLVPDSELLLNQDFSLAAIQPQLQDHTVIHFATHAAFVPGQPEDSFLLFGNGDRATLRDIGRWSLQNVDLVVLSACETGLGGPLGNGEEILGLGYQFQQRGAKASIASLWTVDDGGTEVLMTAFYRSLRKSPANQRQPKSAALRRAQLDMIQGSLNHPYYWAPFILIGNGL